MHPILFHIGPFTVYTYGLWIAIGFFAAMILIMSEAKRQRISPSLVSDLAFWCVIGGIIGARLIYVVYNLSYFLKHPLDILALWKGGLVFFGAILGGLIGGILFLRKCSLSFWQAADLVAPGLALAQGFGRLGCFSAGCCYGKPTHVPWAVVFKDLHSLAPIGIPLHPTQLYHSFACFIMAIILIKVQRRYFTARLLDPTLPYGGVFGLYLLLHGLQRFIIEFFRGDPRPIIFDGFSVTQFFAIIAIITGGIIFFKKR